MCGEGGWGPESLADSDWLDFRCYVEYKAIARQMPSAHRSTVALNSWDVFHHGTPGDLVASGTPASHLTTRGKKNQPIA